MARLFAGTPFDIPPKCERCEKLEEDCECPETPPEKVLQDPSTQTALIRIEKRKKGKVVTTIRQLKAEVNDLGGLCTKLKNHCGAGGTVEGDTIEIQGMHGQRVSEFLAGLGYKIKIQNTQVKKP